MADQPRFTRGDVAERDATAAGPIDALIGIDLVLDAGTLSVLLRPSGSGKSPPLNIIGGLDRPTARRVRFETPEPTTADDGALTRSRPAHVGLVFQFDDLVPSLDAIENVARVHRRNRSDQLRPRRSAPSLDGRAASARSHVNRPNAPLHR